MRLLPLFCFLTFMSVASAAINDSVDALKKKYGPAEVSRYRPDLYPTSYIFKRDGITLTATPFAKLAKKIDIFFEAEQRDSVELLLERFSGRPGWKQLPTTYPAFAKHFPLFNPGGRNSFYSCGDVMALVQRDVGFGKLVFWIQTSDYPDLLAQYRRSKKNA